MIDIPCCSVHTSICKLLWMCIEFTMNKDEYCNQLFVTSFWLHGESCVYLVAYIVTPNQCVQLLSDYITHFNVLRFCVSASLCVCVYLCMHVNYEIIIFFINHRIVQKVKLQCPFAMVAVEMLKVDQNGIMEFRDCPTLQQVCCPFYLMFTWLRLLVIMHKNEKVDI